MSGWPQGQQNGGKPYESLEFTQLDIGRAAAAIADGATSASMKIPWGAGGYKKGKVHLQFSALAAGNVTLKVLSVSPDLKQATLWSVATAPAAIGVNHLDCVWDDGVWPGNWSIDGPSGIFDASNFLNPVWQIGANILDFRLTNNTGDVITMIDAFAVLGG